MSAHLVLLSGIVFAMLALMAGAFVLTGLRRERRLRQRVRVARGETSAARERPAAARGRTPLQLVAALGGAIARSGLLPAKTLSELERTLEASGLRGGNGLGLFVGAKILLLVGCPLLTILALRSFPLGDAADRALPFIAGVVGLLLPDKVVSRNRAKYLAQLGNGIADALDMLVICTQSGLGLTPAMARVAGEIDHAHPTMARELELTVRELQMSVDSGAALAAMGTRTGLDSLKRVATTLAQTIQYGTPLTDALRSLAAEMRQEALTRYEGRAARLPVLLTVPMIMLVLPCIFIVVGGPAVLQIRKSLGH